MDWFEKVLPFAQKASRKTGLPVSVILGQWALESNNGQSRFAREGNNLAGIKYVKNSIAEGYIQRQGGDKAKFAKYDSLAQFTQDYIRVMNLSYYKDVRETAKKNPKDIDKILQALENSPYCYNCKTYAEGIKARIEGFDLQKYDKSTEEEQSQVPASMSEGQNKNNLQVSSQQERQAAILIAAGILTLVGLSALADMVLGGEAENG